MQRWDARSQRGQVHLASHVVAYSVGIFSVGVADGDPPVPVRGRRNRPSPRLMIVWTAEVGNGMLAEGNCVLRGCVIGSRGALFLLA